MTSIGTETFIGETGLLSIDLPAGLKSIGGRAFCNCSGLTSIDIPESVTSIGSGAFINCSNLASVDIPEGVTSIEADTFWNCNLVSVDLPAGLTSIGGRAFYGCTGLTSIDLPDGVTSIGESAFSYCNVLTSIDIPDGVTSIGEAAFSGCTSLTSIVIPDGVTSIEYDTFGGCTSLTSIDIPDGVTRIGTNAFVNCTSLTIIELPDSVTRIDSAAFAGCSSLTSFELPAGLRSIGFRAFMRCTSLVSIVSYATDLQVSEEVVFPETDIRCVVLLSNSVEWINSTNIGDLDEVFAFGDEPLDPVSCGKLYTFLGKGDINSSNYDKLVSLSVSGLDTREYEYSGKPRELDLNIIGNTSGAEMIPLDNETAVDAGWHNVDLAFSFRYDKYGIDIPEIRVKLDESYKINKAPLNVSVSPLSATITYGESCPEFKVAYDGFVNGEGEEVLASLPVVACEGYPNAGTHPVTVSGGAALNYKFNYINGELTVNKAPLTVACGSHTVTYGDDLPKFKLEYDGFVNSEDEGVLSVLPVVKCQDGTCPDVGKHLLTVSGGEARNYDLYYVDGELTVNKAPLTVSCGSYAITYGDELPAFKLEYSGFVNGEDESVLLILPVVKSPDGTYFNAGKYPLTVSGGVARNYDFNYIDGELTVNKATLSVTFDSHITITYGDDLSKIKLEYDGFVNGEDESVLLALPVIETMNGKYSDAGNHIVTASGGEARNYDFSYAMGLMSVNKATLTVSCGSYTITYGDKLPKFKVEYEGFVNGDDEGDLDVIPLLEYPNGVYLDAGKYPLTVSEGKSRNYDFNYIMVN